MMQPPADPGVSHHTAALMQLAERIETLLDEEAKLLRQPVSADLDALIERKNQLLVDLGRLTRTFGPAAIDSPAKPRLEAMAAGLRANAALLKRHIRAVSDISQLVTEVWSALSGDGTYTSAIAGSKARP